MFSIFDILDGPTDKMERQMICCPLEERQYSFIDDHLLPELVNEFTNIVGACSVFSSAVEWAL